MASSSQGLRMGIQIILAIVIVGLAYWLYLSITEPYKVVERQKEMTEMTRDRMSKVRTALTRHDARLGRFPSSLDSLMVFVNRDSLIRANADSIFGPGIVLDSLTYSPRTGKRFEYTLNDTSRVRIYLLKDPDSDDYIGSLEPDVTRLNAASWE